MITSFFQRKPKEPGEANRRYDEDGEDEVIATGSGSSSTTTTSSTTSKIHKFRSEWMNIFPWLVHEDGQMFCKYCRGQKQAGNSVFVTGNKQFKKDSLVKHNISKRHIICRDAFVNGKQPAVAVALEKQTLLSEVEIRRQLSIKMNIAYFVAKEEEPFTKFGPLILLHKKNGVDVNPTYDNHVR